MKMSLVSSHEHELMSEVTTITSFGDSNPGPCTPQSKAFKHRFVKSLLSIT